MPSENIQGRKSASQVENQLSNYFPQSSVQSDLIALFSPSTFGLETHLEALAVDPERAGLSWNRYITKEMRSD